MSFDALSSPQLERDLRSASTDTKREHDLGHNKWALSKSCWSVECACSECVERRMNRRPYKFPLAHKATPNVNKPTIRHAQYHWGKYNVVNRKVAGADAMREIAAYKGQTSDEILGPLPVTATPAAAAAAAAAGPVSVTADAADVAADVAADAAADAAAAAASHWESGPADPLYSFDHARSPAEALTLDAFIKPSAHDARSTEKLVAHEYEVLDAHGNALKGRKARQVLRSTAASKAAPDHAIELDDDFELV